MEYGLLLSHLYRADPAGSRIMDQEAVPGGKHALYYLRLAAVPVFHGHGQLDANRHRFSFHRPLARPEKTMGLDRTAGKDLVKLTFKIKHLIARKRSAFV